MADRDPLSGADNAWRRMGIVENLTTITGVLWFDGKVTYEELCDRLEERLLRFDRFKQQVGARKRVYRQPYWETVEDFDIETHVDHISLPEPVDKEGFEEYIGRLMSRPLDERRPLWEAYLIDDLDDREGNAVAFRINHSLGDGFALLYVLLGLVDDPQDVELPVGSVPSPPGESDVDEVFDEAETTTRSGPDEAFDLTAVPFGRLGAVAYGTKVAYDLLTMDDEVETSLRGELGTRKRASWTENLDLDRIQEIKEVHDATINDVLLAVTAGALRRLFEERGEDTDDLVIRCTAPVNLKPMRDRDEQLGNAFGLSFVPLPVGVEDLDERIKYVRDEVGLGKLGFEAYLMFKTLQFGGRMPDQVQWKLLEMFEDRATGVVTNVPGPKQTLEFCGREVSDMVFWVPQANDQGIGISLFTYAGSVRVGIAGDDNLLPDPSALADHFKDEMAVLEEQTKATATADD
jgi:diacylglycerol O-acyltransferase